MKTKIQIISIWGSLLFEFEKKDNTIKDTLEEAVRRGANLRGANLQEANLRGANLQEANLQEANLRGANLWGANLWGANLWGANLRGANLWEANLRGANLWGAKNLNPLTGSLLSLLKQQKNKLVAYKYVTKELTSPQQGGLDYSIGKTVRLKKDECDYSELIECSEGIHVATLEWCLLNRNSDNPIIEVKFNPKDIVSIPYNTDGKFRLRELKVIRRVPEKELTKFKNRKVV